MAITLQPNELQVFYNNGWTDEDIKSAIDRKRASGASEKEVLNSVYKKLNELDKSTVGENIATNWQSWKRAIPTIGGVVWDTSRKALQDIIEGDTEAVQKGVETFGKVAGSTLAGAGAGALAGSAIPLVGTVGGAVGGGITGLMTGLLGPKGYANAMLSPYGFNFDGGPVFSGQRALYNMRKAPLDVALDVGTISARPIASGAKKALNTEVAKSVPFLKGFSEEYKDVSRAITQSKINAQARLAKETPYLDEIANLNNNILTKDFYKSLITGDVSKISKSKNAIKAREKVLATSRKLEEIGLEEGLLDAVYSADQKVATRLKELLGDNITIAKALDYVSDYKANKSLDESIKKMIEDGYNEVAGSNIAYLTQAVKPNRKGQKPLSKLDERGNIYESKRLIGNTADELYRLVPNSLEYQNKVLQTILGMKESLTNMANKYGRKITVDEWNKGVEGKVISLSYMKEQLAKDFRRMEDLDDSSSDFVKALSTNFTDKGQLASKYKDDLYVIPHDFAEMLANSYKRDSFALNSIMKKSMITSSKWFADNRMGNLFNNMLEGVTLADFADVKKYLKYKPKQIDVTTSYAGQIGDAPSAMSTISKNIREFKNNMVNVIEDRDRLGSTIKAYGNLNDFVTSPLSWLDSKTERLERFANYIRQAKRYAKSNNIGVEDVLKKAQKDNDLFWELYQNTNKSMGDYLGRNYAINPKLQRVVDVLIPFHKFATQTSRITGRQMVRHPLNFLNTIGLGNKYGGELSDEIIRRYNLDPRDYEGGIVNEDISGEGKYTPYRTVRYGGVPFNAVQSSYLSGLEGLMRSTNPLLSVPYQTANFQNAFGKPATREGVYLDYSTGKLRVAETGEEYRPTEQDRLRLLLSNLIQTANAPSVLWNRTVYPFAKGITRGDEKVYPKYDITALRGRSHNIYATPAISSYELMLPLLGLSTPKVYQQYKENNRTRMKRLRQQRRKLNRRDRMYEHILYRNRANNEREE